MNKGHVTKTGKIYEAPDYIKKTLTIIAHYLGRKLNPDEFDNYEIYQTPFDMGTPMRKYKNNIFEIERHFVSDNDESKPKFHFKYTPPKGRVVRTSWEGWSYFKGMSMNAPITEKRTNKMLKDCLISIEEDNLLSAYEEMVKSRLFLSADYKLHLGDI